LLDADVELAEVEAPEGAEALEEVLGELLEELLEAVVAAGVEPLEALDTLSEPDDAAPSAALTAGAGSLVLALPLSPPPLLRKSVTYQPEPLS